MTESVPLGGSPYTFLTAKERDNESNLDYFMARYHSGAQGRFTSVDPENAGAVPGDPQSWNGYAYARNNPLLYTDPTGETYRICDNAGNCDDNYRDADFDKNFQKSKNVRLRGNEIWQKNADGKFEKTGTFKQTDQDLSPEVAGAMGNMARQTGPVVEALGAGTLALTGGAALTAAVGTSGSIATLGRIAVVSGGTANAAQG
jgi:RHS repeat-associated protein